MSGLEKSWFFGKKIKKSNFLNLDQIMICIRIFHFLLGYSSYHHDKYVNNLAKQVCNLVRLWCFIVDLKVTTINVWEMQMFGLGLILGNWIEVSQWTSCSCINNHTSWRDSYDFVQIISKWPLFTSDERSERTYMYYTVHQHYILKTKL